MGKEHSKKRKKKSKSLKKYRSSSSASSSSSLSSIDEETKRKLKKKIKKLRKKEKIKKKEKKSLKKLLKSKLKEETLCAEVKVENPSTSYDVDVNLMEKPRNLAPMTKNEWEKQQNTLKRVLDVETGRMRLVKGTGEIVEECVSRERHLAINKQATKGDGDFTMETSDYVEEFYGVYLLKCLNPKYLGRTYIGYTVDPNRRIKQHNKGKHFGGAWKTSQKGPWEMTLTVHGFPSDVAALRFEWAWQHPKRSRRLKSIVTNKKSSETSFDYCLRVMFTMLRTPPWSRLPLTIRWLSAEVVVEPPPNLTPPVHMPIVYGPVVSKKLKSPKKSKNDKLEMVEADDDENEILICDICNRLLEKEQMLTCLNINCQARWHIICLAKNFLEKETPFSGTFDKNPANFLPVEGSCPECEFIILWGDLIRKKKGCYKKATVPEKDFVDESI